MLQGITCNKTNFTQLSSSSVYFIWDIDLSLFFHTQRDRNIDLKYIATKIYAFIFIGNFMCAKATDVWYSRSSDHIQAVSESLTLNGTSVIHTFQNPAVSVCEFFYLFILLHLEIVQYTTDYFKDVEIDNFALY